MHPKISAYVRTAVELLALSWVALWNGYPVLFFDSGWYIANLFTPLHDGQKAPPYALFMQAMGGQVSLWFVVAAQALVALYVLRLFWQAMGLPADGKRTAAIIFLGATTSLSWEVAHIMPDLFCGLQLVALYLLVFRRGAMSPLQRFELSLLFVLTNSMHPANFLLSAALIVAMGCCYRRVPLGRLRLPALLTALSLLVLGATHYVQDGAFYLSRGGQANLAGRMIEDGIIPRLLAEHCAERHYALCPYADQIPTGRMEFLFSSPVFYKIGGWADSQATLTPVILDAMRYYPWMNLKAALKQTAHQLVMFGSADFIFQLAEPRYTAMIPHFYGQDAYRHYHAGLQSQGRLQSESFAVFQRVVVVLALGYVLCLLWQGHGAIRSHVLFVLAAVLLNAAITGTLSHAEPRYASRLIWLIPLCAVAGYGQRKWLVVKPGGGA